MPFVNPQTVRNWKLVTYFATAGTGFYSIFYATYNPRDPRDHCFSDLQRAYHTRVNSFFNRTIDNEATVDVGRLALPQTGDDAAQAKYTNPLNPLKPTTR